MKNLKQIRAHSLNFLFGVDSNRLVSTKKGEYAQVQALDVPQEGLIVWLKDYGYVKLFRTDLKNQVRHYVIYITNENFEAIGYLDFNRVHSEHYDIEQYHRTIKQYATLRVFR